MLARALDRAPICIQSLDATAREAGVFAQYHLVCVKVDSTQAWCSVKREEECIARCVLPGQVIDLPHVAQVDDLRIPKRSTAS